MSHTRLLLRPGVSGPARWPPGRACHDTRPVESQLLFTRVSGSIVSASGAGPTFPLLSVSPGGATEPSEQQRLSERQGTGCTSAAQPLSLCLHSHRTRCSLRGRAGRGLTRAAPGQRSAGNGLPGLACLGTSGRNKHLRPQLAGDSGLRRQRGLRASGSSCTL